MPAPRSLPGIPDDYTSKLFRGDSITKVADPDFRGKVLRCWADEEGDLPEDGPRHPLDRPLLRGEVGISESKTGNLSIVPESTLVLRQRDFLVGDIVKRSLVNVESAVVIDAKHQVRLTKLIEGEILKGWVPYDKLRSSLILDVRDRVVYDEWLGTVEEVVEEAVVEGQDGSNYRFTLSGGTLGPGRLVAEVINRDPSHHFHQFMTPTLPPSANPSTDVIIEVRPVLVFITWHAINQMLSVAEQDQHPEPKRFWKGEELKDLTHVDASQIDPPAPGSTVIFRDEADEREYGFEPSTHIRGEFKLRALKVVETKSRLRLKWQDGTETEEWSSDLVPHQHIDDYETWPGDHVVWRGDNGERRPAVVQRVNPHQRIADLYFPDNQEKQTVSVLEIDLGGAGKEHYGVGIGLHVMLCHDNLTPLPEVPPIGRFETPMANMMWRNEVAQKAVEYGSQLHSPPSVQAIRPEGDPSKVDWYGDVVDLHPDGMVSVKVVSGEIKQVSIKQLQLLGNPEMLDEMEMDMMDQIDPATGLPTIPLGIMVPDFMHPYDDEEMMSDASWETMSGQDDNGQDDEGEEGGEWVDDDQKAGEGGAEEMEIDEDEQERRDIEEVDPLISPSTSPAGSWANLAQPEAGPSSPKQSKSLPNGSSGMPSLENDEEWQRFEMLEEAPEDHHFIKELAYAAGSKAYHTRLAKEHRALMSSLPENILVRTYENRTDLMRCLIIGPEGTPYANAPFVFDVYLNPMKFPHEPPVVHFHSHTFGKGRCNPNLYEEGKVCLSVLGTWSGDKSESWNPAKSSLLQVFVSISGLVLVRSPYHCEPAFAKLEGTREGRVNSRLYSEKAYVLSRSFVRTALERPPTGLENELRHLYFNKGRLAAVIDHAQRLITKGEERAASGRDEVEEEDAEMWNADAVGSLTMGAILTLKRTIVVLEKILREHEAGRA